MLSQGGWLADDLDGLASSKPDEIDAFVAVPFLLVSSWGSSVAGKQGGCKAVSAAATENFLARGTNF